jgi:acyl carrier protein
MYNSPVASERVRSLVAEVFQIPGETLADDLAMADVPAWDSLKHMELVMSLERAFGLTLTFDEIVAMRSIRDIERVLAARETRG